MAGKNLFENRIERLLWGRKPTSRFEHVRIDNCRSAFRRCRCAIECLGLGWKADIAHRPFLALTAIMSEFTSEWKRHHPTAPPVAHILREVERETWVRFHSLPLSKRYATSKREKWMVLDRANRLASRVLGDGSRCWLVQAEPDYEDAANDTDAYGTIGEYRLEFQFEHPPLKDDCGYRIFAAPVVWSAGAFNDLISKRADDQLPLPTMWVSVESGVAFAPYDGGSDLFLSNAEEVDSLKRDFSDWLSDHPEGL